MREIKFRAWDSELNKFMGDGDITFSDYGDTYFKVNPNSIEYVGDKCHSGEPQRDRFYLGQFTGLKDKNGVEIFEGDLFEVLLEDYGNGNITKVVGEVVFMFGFFVVRFLDPIAIDHRNYHLHKFLHDNKGKVIIGNIHQNPELITA